jgi:hypothetical protein
VSDLRKGNVLLPLINTRSGRKNVRLIVPGPHDTTKMYVAISAAGVFYTGDGCRSWQPRNCGTRAEILPDKHPGFGQCVHKLLPAADGRRLYQQNDCGVYRSNSRPGRSLLPDFHGLDILHTMKGAGGSCWRIFFRKFVR